MTEVWRYPTVSPGVGAHAYPLRLVSPRGRDKSQFVERWKVIRDRNKNLPNLDFTTHSVRFPLKVCVSLYNLFMLSTNIAFDGTINN